MGIQPRVEMSFLDEETMLEYQSMGVKHWCMGPDTVVWFDYLNKQVTNENVSFVTPCLPE